VRRAVMKKNQKQNLNWQDYEHAARSNIMPKRLHGERREVALQANPDLDRKLLEEEIKLARHQRSRQQAIGARLSAEELRRQHAYWTSPGKGDKILSFPLRMVEATAMMIGLGSAKAGISALMEDEKTRKAINAKLGTTFVSPSKRIEQGAFERLVRQKAEEHLTRIGVGKAKPKSFDYRTQLRTIQPHFASNPGLEDWWKELQAAKADEVVDDAFKKMWKKSITIHPVDFSTAPPIYKATKIAEKVSDASFRDAVTGSPEWLIERDKALKRYENNAFVKAGKRGVNVASSIGNTISAALGNVEAQRGIGEKISKVPGEDLIALGRKSARTKLALGAGVAAAVVGGGIILTRQIQKKRMEQELKAHQEQRHSIYEQAGYQIDPSKRVEKSWLTRRRKYGESGMHG
jgi:hypothetical protein